MNPWKHRGRQELAVCEEMGPEEIRRGAELTLPQQVSCCCRENGRKFVLRCLQLVLYEDHNFVRKRQLECVLLFILKQ